VDIAKVQGEVLDLMHGMGCAKLPTVRVTGGDDYALSADSDIVVITAGVRQRPGETRTALVHRNEVIVTAIAKKIAQYSPDCIMLLATNPVDVMCYLAWRVSGFPSNRVLGTGTSLDSSRFKHLLAEKLRVDPRSMHALVIGEHGDSAVPLFSSVHLAGTPFTAMDPSFGESEESKQLGKKVIQCAYDVIKLKGYTSWGIGLVVSSLVVSILRDEAIVLPVSTLVPAGLYGLPASLYLSLPVVLSRVGVRAIVKQRITSQETKLLLESGAKLLAVQKSLMICSTAPAESAITSRL